MLVVHACLQALPTEHARVEAFLTIKRDFIPEWNEDALSSVQEWPFSVVASPTPEKGTAPSSYRRNSGSRDALNALTSHDGTTCAHAIEVAPSDSLSSAARNSDDHRGVPVLQRSLEFLDEGLARTQVFEVNNRHTESMGC